MKPRLHFGPAKGWMNDPNGLIDRHGVHHLFFQHNPADVTMNEICWGHATSTDLLTWTEHPLALVPGPTGTYDDDGCWSGCAVEHDGSVVVLYSANHDGAQLPALARAMDDDLVTWAKDPANPIIPTWPAIDGLTDMRDHSLRRDGGLWRQVLAAGGAGEGMLVGYSSPDLETWTFDGVVLARHDVGVGGDVWECPDVFADPAGDTASAVAIFSIMEEPCGPVMWVTGTFDGHRVLPSRRGLLDYGDRFYAPQSYTDSRGRRVMFGWVRTQLDPAAAGGESIGLMTLPRILTVVDGRLCQSPADEVRERRGHPVTFSVPEEPTPHHLGVSNGSAPAGAGLVTFELEVSGLRRDAAASLAVTLEGVDGTRAIVAFDVFSSPEHVLADGHWRHAPPAGPGGAAGGSDADTPTTSATLVVDAGVFEVFLADGRAATFTDARIGPVSSLVVQHEAGSDALATLWPLR